MKSLALLFFLFLVVPGSGQLVWDGLPLSTRAEVSALMILTIAITNQRICNAVRERISRTRWRGVLTPALGVLILLKLLTFAWYPFSDGFDACYRSIYNPLENLDACEKSYEVPFLRRSDLGLSNTSRIDRTVDFGTHAHDWSLPFMNEYPRLDALWLDRFPFTAQYGAILQNESESPKFLPVLSIGSMTATAGSSESTVNNYEFEQLTLLRIEPGSTEFNLRYEYRDSDANTPPEEAPVPRGPYASLKVGQLADAQQLAGFVQLRVRGWVFDEVSGLTPDFVAVEAGSIAKSRRFALVERPDVATHFGRESVLRSGFDFSLPMRDFETGTIELVAIYGEVAQSLGTLSLDPRDPSRATTASIAAEASLLTQFSAVTVADRDDFSALAPEARRTTGLLVSTLLLGLDLLVALLVLASTVGLLVVLRKSSLIAVGLGLTALAILNVGSRAAPIILGSRLFLPLLILAGVVAITMRFSRPESLTAYLPLSLAISIVLGSDHLSTDYLSGGSRWWGRLLYYWRDSDWYVTQGYARTIFLEGSLRGGEAVFWFQAGPRYLALVTRLLFGENDAMIGFIAVALGFFAATVLVERITATHKSIFIQWLSPALLVVLWFMLADDVMVMFGFVGSSEYPTWTALFLITGFVAVTRTESRAWLLVGMSLALGYSTQLRPNQIGGVVLLFVALLLTVDRTDAARAISTIGKMTVSFAAVTSFSLWHNLYYGETFVPFTANAGINYAFSWFDVFGLNSGEATWANVWEQMRYMMYWNPAGNWAWALAFWGSQLLWLCLVAARIRRVLALRARSLLLLIPFGYALPMLKFQMGSYYPRHLVVINLSFMCAALMAWPRSDEFSNRNSSAEPEAAELANSDDSTPVAAPAPDPMVSAVSR